MLQSNAAESSSRAFNDLVNKIKQLLQHQCLAVTRVSSIGINRDEAKEMHARIDQVLELLEQLHDLK
jgi:hypothetical protein